MKINTTKLNLLNLVTLLFLITGCSQKIKFTENFNEINDRIWISEEFWPVPMEDWNIKECRIECTGNKNNMRMNLLTTWLSGEGNLNLSLQMGWVNPDMKDLTAGVRIAIQDNTDNDYRSLCYFGNGIDIGVTGNRKLFIGEEIVDLPVKFDLSSFALQVTANNTPEENKLTAKAIDATGLSEVLEITDVSNFEGMVSLFSNHPGNDNSGENPHCWFDNLSLSGNMLEIHPEREFGPILWTMYTLSKETLKLSAQFPPISDEDPQTARLQMKNENAWIDLTEASIDPDSRVAVFRVENLNEELDHNYRVVYNLDGEDHFYEGTIRKDPINKELVMGGMTCQYGYGFPYRPLVENLETLNPDILYFSGDQIYESNGGYGIIRFPADRAILNYLGKWYMFGWAFGDLMRDRPSIVIPDDHEVYQGNLWGAGGKKVSEEDWEANRDATSGFVEPAEMVNVVMHTNSSHLPDPYDPAPMKQGIDVYYTDLVYGGISFAIVGDRIFKSGPENVSTWEGRKDHLRFEPKDPSLLEKEGLKLLGDRQLEFLNHWITDWEGSYMKVLLSQTIFANPATHHGTERDFLVGDLDSGGWPKSARDRALEIVRKAFAFHIAGDQHLPSFIQYGIDNYRDAGWAFCTPAITVGYQRRFMPDLLGWEVKGRPDHGNPNTGLYTDVFGNPTYVYAVGNPEDEAFDPNRYEMAEKRASGFGLITFDTNERTIESNAYRFLAEVPADGSPNQFPGWPVTIDQTDNYGRKIYGYLPELQFESLKNPVVRIYKQDKNELVYNLRIKGNSFKPFVFEEENYVVEYGLPGDEIFNRTKTLQVSLSGAGDIIRIE
ncbi:MAG: alkaline phosphatase D family protein [Bacteroidales bacterium]